MHVSAGNPFRRWPAERFAELAAALATTTGLNAVVITSGPSEADAASRVAMLARALAGDDGERIVRGAASSIWPNSRRWSPARALYIGGDSGPLHVAATTRTPIGGALRSDASRAIDALARPALTRLASTPAARLPPVPPAHLACRATSGV